MISPHRIHNVVIHTESDLVVFRVEPCPVKIFLGRHRIGLARFRRNEDSRLSMQANFDELCSLYVAAMRSCVIPHMQLVLPATEGFSKSSRPGNTGSGRRRLTSRPEAQWIMFRLGTEKQSFTTCTVHGTVLAGSACSTLTLGEKSARSTMVFAKKVHETEFYSAIKVRSS